MPAPNDKFPTCRKGGANLKWMLGQADHVDMSEGQTAYVKYNAVMRQYSDRYGYQLSKVTAAFCALSPNNDYVGNLRSLTSVIEGLRDGTEHGQIIISTYNHCKYRAIKYLTGEDEFDTDKRGLKIRSFYHNIISPGCPKNVTIDGHIAAAFCGDPNLVMKDVILSRKMYREISAVVNRMAKKAELLPNQLQAIIWFTRKRIYRIKYSPIRDMFSDPSDQWRIMIPLDELKAYPLRAA